MTLLAARLTRALLYLVCLGGPLVVAAFVIHAQASMRPAPQEWERCGVTWEQYLGNAEYRTQCRARLGLTDQPYTTPAFEEQP